jgi:hypothetical protein
MTVEELLIQRYKVIADYPNSHFKIGDIVKKHFFDVSQKGTYTYLTNVKSPLQGLSLRKEFIETMPHLFKKLEWWEERGESDFLELKFAKTIAGNSVRAVLRIELYWNKILLDGGKVKQISHWLPATEDEYRAYKLSITQF